MGCVREGSVRVGCSGRKKCVSGGRLEERSRYMCEGGAMGVECDRRSVCGEQFWLCVHLWCIARTYMH